MITAALVVIVLIGAYVLASNLQRKKQKHERELERIRKRLEEKEAGSEPNNKDGV